MAGNQEKDHAQPLLSQPRCAERETVQEVQPIPGKPRIPQESPGLLCLSPDLNAGHYNAPTTPPIRHFRHRRHEICQKGEGVPLRPSLEKKSGEEGNGAVKITITRLLGIDEIQEEPCKNSLGSRMANFMAG